jgi:hypothetical protein
MLSLKAQKPRESNTVTVAVSRGNRMTNSIGRFFETLCSVHDNTFLLAILKACTSYFVSILGNHL